MFQTHWPSTTDLGEGQEQVLEIDDTGQHLANYFYSKQSDGSLRITKRIESHDYIEMQFHQVNFQQIQLAIEQNQTFSSGGILTQVDGQLVSKQGKHQVK